MTTRSVAHRLSDEIRAGMARRRITQEDLAGALHLSQPAVSRRLRGKVPFDVEELATVAGLLGVRAADLVALAEERPS